ncbi:MAG: hypothetical protein V4492_07510, partial [Chlamydiota bacterium]
MSAAECGGFYKDDMATAPLRFMHLYQDLLSSERLTDPKLKVMTLGLGCLFAHLDGGARRQATFPQHCELLALLEMAT